MRVAVFGASGFVGATLVEQLWAGGAAEVRPIIHSSGNAARLARHGRPLVIADLMAPASLASALDGCTHVVNCARGPADVMIRGLQHLLDACARANVTRFVHLSSVAVYGEGHQGVLVESATAAPAPYSYGDTKRRQDRLVAKAARGGLSSIVLCPPNISGPYSAFLLEIVDAMRRGQLALVDGGERPCALVDVMNLVHAIQLALHAPHADGERIFITDDSATTWADVAASLARLADATADPPALALEEATVLVARAEPPEPSVRRALRHLLSSDVRQALKRDAWFGHAERTLKTTVRRVPVLDRSLRTRFASAGPPKKAGGGALSLPSARLLKQQLRGVTYDTTRARQLLDYRPVVDTRTSMDRFAAWYTVHFGWGDRWWPLLQHLRAEN